MSLTLRDDADEENAIMRRTREGSRSSEPKLAGPKLAGPSMGMLGNRKKRTLYIPTVSRSQSPTSMYWANLNVKHSKCQAGPKTFDLGKGCQSLGFREPTKEP